MERVLCFPRTPCGSGRGEGTPHVTRSDNTRPPHTRLLVALALAAAGTTACADDSEPFAPLAHDAESAAMSATASSSAINSLHASGMCLDIVQGLAVIASCDGSGSQQFTFASDGSIRSKGLCLATRSSNAPRGDRVVLASCNGAANQRWSRTRSNEIRGINGYCVDVYAERKTSGSSVVVWTCHGGSNQKWSANTIQSSDFRLIPSLHAANKCLVVREGLAMLGTCDGGSDQRFVLGSDGTIRFDGLCLATRSATPPRGDRVVVARCNGAANQKWRFTSAREIRGVSGYCVDVYQERTRSGSAVVVWSCHGGSNQKWELSGSPPPPPPPPPPASGGGAGHRGRILFTEPFDNGSLGSRGWYDFDSPRITTSQRAPGSSGSFECRFPRGATECAGGVPGRHRFDAVDQMYVSYWVKFQNGWVGSGKPYHPHEFHFLNSLEGRYAAPAYTRLTLYVEHVAGRPQVALQDGANVDKSCILRNNNSLVGCSGHTIDSYPFTEHRSVAACNGLVGPVDGRDCFDFGGGRWYSSRTWRSSRSVTDGQWHFVETYIRLNSVSGGRGIADGVIRQWVDGQRTLNASGVLFRTGEHPDLRINQVLFAPYIGDGSPIEQSVWYDDLTIAVGRMP